MGILDAEPCARLSNSLNCMCGPVSSTCLSGMVRSYFCMCAKE